MNPDTDSLEELIASITDGYKSMLTTGASTGVHMHVSPSLGSYITSTPHRGTDIESSSKTINSGTEYPDSPKAGDVFYRTDLGVAGFYNGRSWSEFSVSSPDLADELDSADQSIVEWAASKLPNDNDVLYIRRKNDRLFWTEGNKYGGTEWKEINGTGILPTGLKQEIIDIDNVVQAPVEEVVTPDIATGWYQDEKGELYEYLGEGKWDAPNKMSNVEIAARIIQEKLNLEFLG